jgi:hypothetical protein
MFRRLGTDIRPPFIGSNVVSTPSATTGGVAIGVDPVIRAQWGHGEHPGEIFGYESGYLEEDYNS